MEFRCFELQRQKIDGVFNGILGGLGNRVMDNFYQEPRVLYCDIFTESLNPTSTHTAHLIWTAFPNTQFFGPGFSSERELSLGLADWARDNGPFDLIVLGPNTGSGIFDSGNCDASSNFLTRYAAGRSSQLRISTFLKAIPDELERLEIGFRMISLLNFDYYAATKVQIDRIKDHGFHVLSANEQFVTSVTGLPDFVKHEKHYQRKEKRINDCFRDFLIDHPEKVVTALHFVLPHEFHFCSFEERENCVAVPGIDYYKRRKAIDSIRSSSLRLVDSRHLKAYKIADKLGMRPYGRYLTLKGYQSFYTSSLRSNKYIYTSRGGFGFPVRKFFEIPAAGGLMLCDPCTGYHELGYQNQRDFVFCEPDDVVEMVKRFESLPQEEIAEIARNGQRVTWNLHSIVARGAQVRESVLTVLAGTYQCSRWMDGKFQIEKSLSPPENS